MKVSYPAMYPAKVVGQSFKGVKRQTVPNQSMSLREIVQRFVRRESLPMSKEGVYEDRFGDLEKLSKEDIFIQMEKVKELQGQIAAFNKRQQDKAEKQKADELARQTAGIQTQSVGTAAVSAKGDGAAAAAS